MHFSFSCLSSINELGIAQVSQHRQHEHRRYWHWVCIRIYLQDPCAGRAQGGPGHIESLTMGLTSGTAEDNIFSRL